MNETNKILAESLLEWTLASKTEWLDAEEKDIKELKTIAEKKGILFPNPDIALFKTYYAEMGVANRNKVLLEKADVEKSLATLIGKQINFDHEGASHICGYILDAKIEKNMIVAYGCIFKSLFKDKFDTVKAKFSKGELFVSFEIYNVNPDTKESVMKILDNGTRVISPIIFHGMGLLTYKPPACPKARVTTLLAEYIDESIITEANKIIDHNYQESELVYAELALPCQNCKDCQHKQGGQIMADSVEDAKKIGEPIDPNLFVKADGTLDEEKCEAALPKEVTSRVKELIKEGKAPAEAVKQAWKEYKDNKSKGEDEAKAAEEARIKAEADAKVKADEEAARIQAEADEKARKEAELAHTPREGNQNFTCPECKFTMPLLAEGVGVKYCAGCGLSYNENADENPVYCELMNEVELPNEEDIHNEEEADLADAAKLPYGKRQELPDSDFAVVVKKGDKKIRKFPIHDEAHVRNALARLGQAKPRETLKGLGVSVESVKRKILARARKLGMTDLVSRYQESSALEGEAILNLSNTVADLTAKLDTQAKETDKVKADLAKVTQDKETEVTNLKQELDSKNQEIASLKEGIPYVVPSLNVGSVNADTPEVWKQKQEKIDEIAFGKKKDKK